MTRLPQLSVCFFDVVITNKLLQIGRDFGKAKEICPLLCERALSLSLFDWFRFKSGIKAAVPYRNAASFHFCTRAFHETESHISDVMGE